MTTAQTVIDDVARTLIDQGSTRRWPDSELLDYLNESMLVITLFKPTAYVKTVGVLMATGSKQTVPSDCALLLEAVTNLGTDPDNLVEGRVVNMVDRKSLNEGVPTWRAEDQATNVVDCMYDPMSDPKTFYVYPPSDGTGHIGLSYSAIPEPLALAGTILLDNTYVFAMKEFMLFRAFEKDSDAPNSALRAQTHFQLFTSMLGVKLSMEQVNSAHGTAEPAMEGTR